MACQRRNNQVCRAATFSGVSKKASKALAAVSTIGMTWSALNLRSAIGDLRTASSWEAHRAALGWTAFYGFSLAANAVSTVSLIRDLQARKKVFTRHVVVDKDGSEIGWSYDLAAARRTLRSTGDRLLPVQEKVDYAEVQKFLRTREFQWVERQAKH